MIEELINDYGYISINESNKKETLTDLLIDKTGYLDNYLNMGFEFVKNKSEFFPIKKDLSFKVFGRCFLGWFALSEAEEVHLISNEEGFIVFEKDIVFVDKNFYDFITSYSLFLSKIFILKANFFALNNNLLGKISYDFFQEVIEARKPSQHAYEFWEHISYLIEDDGVILRNNTISAINFMTSNKL